MPPARDPLPDSSAGSLLAAGLGLVAVLAMGAIMARKRRGKPDVRRPASLKQLLQKPPAPRRKPPEAGLAVPAVPPTGPMPISGGAAAALDFERD